MHAPPLFPLWVLEKAGAIRAASLYAHPLGFEIRIVDRTGLFVRTVVVKGTEAEAKGFAVTIEQDYTARGWGLPTAGGNDDPVDR
jgi:hypothetical protein